MKIYFIFFLLIFFAKENLWAQKRFTVNSTIGCAPFTVEVTGNPADPDYAASTETSYRYDDDLNYTSSTTHTYTEPGTYIITQHLNTFADKLRTEEITVVEGEKPQFNYYICNNRQIFVTVTDDTYPAYFLNFGDGTTPPPIAPNETYSHTYTNTTPKTISVTGLINGAVSPGHAANNDCGIDHVTIVPLEDLPVPTLNQVNVLDGSSIEIHSNTVENLQYQVEISENGSTGFTEIGEPSPSGNFIAEGLNTRNNYYCFRLALKDPCDPDIPDVYSNEICTATTTVTAENDQNRISWESGGNNIQNIELYKENILLATLNANQSPFLDTDILCNNEYCYYVKVNFTQGFSTTDSNCVTGISQTSPPALENITANVYDKDIHIEWPNPEMDVKEFLIEKSQVDGTYELINSTGSNIYLDKGVDLPESFHCYKINYEDECGNIAYLSNDVCPVLLTVSENETYNYDLTWTNYSGWEEGVSHYILEKIDKDGNVFETLNMGPGVNSYVDDYKTSDRQIILYRITAVSNNPENWLSYSNVVRMEQEVKVFLPTAFTPNGDNINDVFEAKGTFIKEFNMKIFNRWGELLFNSDDRAVGWDGNFRGQPVHEGSYVYSVKVTDNNDKTISLSGTFMLIRKRRN